MYLYDLNNLNTEPILMAGTADLHQQHANMVTTPENLIVLLGNADKAIWSVFIIITTGWKGFSVIFDANARDVLNVTTFYDIHPHSAYKYK